MTKTTLSLIEHLDFDYAVPCECVQAWHPQDPRPSTKRILYSHPCGMSGSALVCTECCRRVMRESGWVCNTCGERLEFLSEIVDSIVDL